ncbi:MAG: peptidylprolyl isomerase [Candidatus Aminicenantales bacterium]
MIKTELGDITARIDSDKAPITAANFMRYVDAKLYDGTTFFRVVTKEESAPNQAEPIEVVQGGQVDETREYPPIAHETTAATGLKHLNGALSMARAALGTATSSFSIIINDQPAMDFGGKRNPDGQGFAVFGYVISGMEVARKIHRLPHEGQRLKPPITIISIRRLE